MNTSTNSNILILKKLKPRSSTHLCVLQCSQVQVCMLVLVRQQDYICFHLPLQLFRDVCKQQVYFFTQGLKLWKIDSRLYQFRSLQSKSTNARAHTRTLRVIRSISLVSEIMCNFIFFCLQCTYLPLLLIVVFF